MFPTPEESQNPYQSPEAVPRYKSWWKKLWEFFECRLSTREFGFAKGKSVVVCEGIAYFVTPGKEDVLYAVSPSSVHTEDRLDLIVDEAIRILPNFLESYPRLHSIVLGRKLIVYMAHSYTDVRPIAEYGIKVDTDIVVGQSDSEEGKDEDGDTVEQTEDGA